MYSEKCSNSFAKQCQSDELKKVVQLLGSCEKTVRTFLESHFNQRSVSLHFTVKFKKKRLMVNQCMHIFYRYLTTAKLDGTIDKKLLF